MSESAKHRNNTNLTNSLKQLFAIAIFITLVVIGFYFVNFYGGLSDDQVDWGTFGDYVGGVLNPLLALIALLALLKTINMQSEALNLSKIELQLTREELAKSSLALESQSESLKQQNFESAFFQMLRLHNDIVNSIDLNPSSASGRFPTKGRDCFAVFYDRLLKMYRSKSMNSISDTWMRSSNTYKQFYTQTQTDLGHYFRYLYNIFKFIDNADVDDKKFYSNLVRAQLSNPELVLLFYNGLSCFGKEKFMPLIKKYSILKNLPPEMLLDAEHYQVLVVNTPLESELN